MCGIFGVVGVRKAAEWTVIGLHGIQHRAIDYAGIVSSDGSQFYRKAGKGIVRQVFTKQEDTDGLHGKDALGHIRYPTVTDDEGRENIQPIVGSYAGRPIAIAHNGNLTNTEELAKLVPAAKLHTSMDTEYILRLLEMRATGNIEADLASVLPMLRGSFALGILLPDCLIAVADKSGNRPLSLGTLDGGYCVSSETCAFPNVGAKYLSDVDPGTMVIIKGGKCSVTHFAQPDEKRCRFEGIYYSHPASLVFGEDVGDFRMAIGRKLEELFPVVGADVVTAIPDSSNLMAQGYGESRRSGVYAPILVSRSHYVGRTFIAATQAKRDIEVAQKFTFAAQKIAGKKIVVVDDSVVRGTTLPKIVTELLDLGAKQVHIRIGSPPIMYPCHYGINTPTRDELISVSLTPEAICRKIGADSLEFLPLEVLKTMSPNQERFCFSCMTGDYW